MEYIKQLIKVVDKNKSKNIQLIGYQDEPKNKLNELYAGILSGDFSSDEEACSNLYDEKINQNYRNLKSRLERRLINTLFFIDVNSSSYSDYQKAYFNCYKNLAAIKILQSKAARFASIKLSEKTLKQALKYHFTEVVIFLVRDLRNFYGTIVGDRKKFKSYNLLMSEYQTKYKNENDALEMYTTLASYYADTKSSKPELLEKAERFSDFLSKKLSKNNSLSFCFYAHLVFALKCEIENDFETTIEVCDKAINEVTQFENISSTHVFSFLFKKLNSLIQIKRYEEAEVVVKECLTLQIEGSINWLITLQFYFILLFRSQNYQKAYELFESTDPLKKSKNAPQILKELWQIINAYLYYFVSIGKIHLPENVERRRFRINKFLNEVPVFSKDQRGMKVSILILHLLFLLHQKKYSEVISRTEALQAYASKHLRKDETYRSNCFIKMLLQIPAADFNIIALERKAKVNFEKLKSKPLELANQPNEIEMVPYEILWEFVLDSLKRKKQKHL